MGRPRGRGTRLERCCASLRFLLLGERQRLLPLKAEFLHSEHDCAWPDLRDPEAADDVTRLGAIPPTCRDVPQYGDTACGKAVVVHDGHELEIGNQRTNVARLEQ